MASKHRLGRWWKSLSTKEKNAVSDAAVSAYLAPIVTTIGVGAATGNPALVTTGALGAMGPMGAIALSAVAPTKAEIKEFMHHMRSAGHKLRKVV